MPQKVVSEEYGNVEDDKSGELARSELKQNTESVSDGLTLSDNARFIIEKRYTCNHHAY